MYFGICNCYTIKYVKPKGNKAVLVRCLNDNEYSKSTLTVQNNETYNDILQLNLEDNKFMSLENIQLLNDFIVNNDFDEVIAHCALGISRSPAIMICISKILQIPSIEAMIKEKYTLYNKSIVETFETFPYQEKTINDTEAILRNLYKENEDEKILIKKKWNQ